MSNQYYNLPLALGDILLKKELPGIPLKESISKWIHLLATTRFGECKFDEFFGCEIWEHDFENLDNSQKFKEDLTRSFLQSIKQYEPRLSDVRVEIQIEQVELIMQYRRIKIRIGMKVMGTITKTNEVFNYMEYFFIGPLSYS